MPSAASLNIEVSSGLSTGCTAKICGWRQNVSMAREITVRPPIERYCFGPPAPARSPRPAATIMAAVRFGGEIAIHKGRAPAEFSRGAEPYHAVPAKTERFHALWVFCCTALARSAELSKV